VIGWLADAWIRRRDSLFVRFARLRPAFPLIAVGLLLALSFAREPEAMTAIARSPVHVVRDHILGGQRPAMSRSWVESQVVGLSQVEQLRRATGRTPVIWSTYAGLLEWQVGVFHPETDYINHTLGPERRSAYAATFIAK